MRAATPSPSEISRWVLLPRPSSTNWRTRILSLGPHYSHGPGAADEDEAKVRHGARDPRHQPRHLARIAQPRHSATHDDRAIHNPFVVQESDGGHHVERSSLDLDIG